ncbi:hypothetical protein FGG08_002997 [Glutinoglossum americanum]|uniref:Aminotransferase class I/classII large domain-containing protein n=1 Tax=Glutinoglossum americanum TaxID=1670608 RepID=A0A9P8I575_9PEZI|nr:hypothetical protein FGG08_002997 [Glutinoglossum americanum]
MASKFPKQQINFKRGWPNPSLLPVAHIKAAADTVLSNPSIAIPGLLYGPDLGYEPLREEIAKWLTKFYAPSNPILSGRICITGGASQNLACILQAFSDPLYTRNVWMVAPTYYLACGIFEDSGFAGKLRAVPEDEEGIDMRFLGQAILKSEAAARLEGNDKPTIKPNRPWGKIYSHIIYAVPTFSNPSSKTMSLARRSELVHLARDYDALIITDDVYDFLQWSVSEEVDSAINWGKAVLPRLVDIDRELDGGAERGGADGFGNVASNGSFSKIIGPGVRTGWNEGTDKFTFALSLTGSTKSGGAASQLTATFIFQLLQSRTLHHHILRTLQPFYATNYRTLLVAITTYLLPLGLTLQSQPAREIVGGYFVWLTLPPPLTGKELSRRALEEENLIVTFGEMFEVKGDEEGARFTRELRLCFAWEEEGRLVEGVERLACVIRRMKG